MCEVGLLLRFRAQDSPTSYWQATGCTETLHPVSLYRVRRQAVVHEHRRPGKSVCTELGTESLGRDVGLMPDEGSGTRK